MTNFFDKISHAAKSKNLLFAITAITLAQIFLLHACKGKDTDVRLGSSGETQDNNVEESSSSTPAMVTGSNLIDASTADITYTVSSSGSTKLISAQAKYKDPKTQELMDTGGLASGYKITWRTITDSNGESISSAVCKAVANELKYECQYTGNVLSVKLGFILSDANGLETQIGIDRIVPAVTSVDLTNSPVLAINGDHFADLSFILIGSKACTNPSLESSTEITCTLPSGLSSGVYSITIKFTKLYLTIENLLSIQDQTGNSSFNNGEYVLFTTKTAANHMNVGGPSGVNSFCRTAAQTSGALTAALGISNWLALVSISGFNGEVSLRITVPTNAVIKNPNGVVLATSSDQLWFLGALIPLNAPPNTDEYGATVTGTVAVGHTGQTCGDWTSSIGISYYTGLLTATNGDWYSNGTSTCDQPAHFYCLGEVGN